MRRGDGRCRAVLCCAVMWCGVVRCGMYHSTERRNTAHHDLSSPHFTSPHLSSPHFTSAHLTSPQRTSPHLTSPHLTSPHFTYTSSLLFSAFPPLILYFSSLLRLSSTSSPSSPHPLHFSSSSPLLRLSFFTSLLRRLSSSPLFLLPLIYFNSPHRISPRLSF